MRVKRLDSRLQQKISILRHAKVISEKSEEKRGISVVVQFYPTN
jgi:hypothetical protein